MNLTNFINLRKNPVVRSVGIYTFSNFFAKGVSFLLLVVFTNPHYILPSENGLLSLFSNSMLFLMPFLSMGIIHSTSTDYFKLDKKEFPSFFTTGFVMPTTIMLVSIITLFLFRKPLQEAYGFPYMFCWLIPVITFLTFCNEQLLGLARNNNEPMTYLKANVFKTITEFSLSFILVVFFFWRWEGRIAGILVSYALVGAVAFYYFTKRGYLSGKIKKEYIIEELIYAVPVIAMQASIFAMNASDKFFLSNFTTDKNETVGIYSVGCIFASTILLFSSALNQYVFPKIYLLLASVETDYRSIRKLFLFHITAMASGTLLIILLIPLLYHTFINAKYHPALKYNYLLCVGYFLWTVNYFFYSYLLYYKKKKKLLLLSICCIIISLTCNYFFIKQWTDIGAAVSVFTCYLLVLILTLLFTKEYWRNFLFKPK
ncbi:MAG: polysaccharide biosynthesis C-terminal domain-containing protein [Ferruginibacter sp.]